MSEFVNTQVDQNNVLNAVEEQNYENLDQMREKNNSAKLFGNKQKNLVKEL